MEAYADIALRKLMEWFSKADNWQKDLFLQVWSGSYLDSQLVDRANKVIRQEYLTENHRLTPFNKFPEDISFDESTGTAIGLLSISNIKGVGALAPCSALTFGNGLTVVYGENGCGKSSYVRILKALENPINSDAVIGNVFEERNAPPEATITFLEDGDEKSVLWNKSLKKKFPIQIYDTIEADRFVNKENEVIYEPKVLATITRMVRIYDQLSECYDAVSCEIANKLVQIPHEVHGHTIIQEFNGLSNMREVEAFAKKIIWNDDFENELVAISTGLKESDPSKAAKAKIAQRELLRAHGYEILKLLQLVDDEGCKNFLDKRKKQIETKNAADYLVSKSRDASSIEGFGSDTWKLMWMRAIEYIREVEGSCDIPVTISGQCALCQQELDDQANIRIQAFKSFCESKAITKAENAFKDFEIIVRRLQDDIENKIDISEFNTIMQSALIPEKTIETVIALYQSILDRCDWLLSYDDELLAEIPVVFTEEDIKEIFKGIVDKLNMEIKVLQEMALNKENQVKRLNALIATRWVYNNLPNKIHLVKIKTICSKCKTNALTSLKNDLSKLLITNTYISRFQEEMNLLDSRKQIKVELVATSPRKGKSYHHVSLKGACSAGKHKNGEILSEGEFRVVSLASFLADLSSWHRNMPFIFDDPITSLDHKYEASVASRLISLSRERQVIVFTHRLAFAQLLEASATAFNAYAAQNGSTDRAEITHIELRNSPLGHPTTPNYVNNMAMEKALDSLLKSDVAAIKQLQNLNDYETADRLIQSLCAKFRNVIEYGIEQNLLSGIISRFARNISSLKLPRLYAVTQEDIHLFDSMMTKYSYFDHSHAIELPVPLPTIESIEHDLIFMMDWAKKFNKRCDTEQKKAKGKY